MFKKKVGQKPAVLFTKSIHSNIAKKGFLYNPVLGTYHELLPDPHGVNGESHWVDSFPLTCENCGKKASYRELWGTVDYSVMYCQFCNTYIWKSQRDNYDKLVKACKLTDYKMIEQLMGTADKIFRIPSSWIKDKKETK